MSNKPDNKENTRLSAIDEDILTVLIGGRELYGLEILDNLNLDREDKLGSKLGFGSLYPALNRLEKKGFIQWRWGDETDDSGGARRKYYKMTGLGSDVLNQVQAYRASLSMRAMQGQQGWGGV
jgi:PadR family transcriptional regulator, regulatory protein PadR